MVFGVSNKTDISLVKNANVGNEISFARAQNVSHVWQRGYSLRTRCVINTRNIERQNFLQNTDTKTTECL